MLAPSTLVSASERQIRLSENVHVPHGNFFDAEEKWISIEEMNIEGSVDQYLRNGVADHELDLHVFKFRRGNEVLIISKGRDGFRSVGSISGIELNGSEISDSSMVLSLSANSGYLTLSRKA